jgi:hypothetical protein
MINHRMFLKFPRRTKICSLFHGSDKPGIEVLPVTFIYYFLFLGKTYPRVRPCPFR